MGHAIEIHSFATNFSKDRIISEMNEIAREESDSHGPLYERIEFVDKTFDSVERAREYITANDRPYRNFAVKYRYQKDFEQSKSLETLKKRTKVAYETWNAFASKYHFKDAKSEFIGCKNCNSKIASKYMVSRNYCPVCKADMRPASTIDRIDKFKEKYEELKKLCNEKEQEERMNSLSKADTYWLVKIEYHD